MHIHNRLPSVSKYRFLVCFVFVSATLQYSCNPGEEQEPLTFPSAYQYQELEFQTTKYYVLTTNSYNEIAASGNYLEFDNILKDILEINSTEFEIEKLELEVNRIQHYYENVENDVLIEGSIQGLLQNKTFDLRELTEEFEEWIYDELENHGITTSNDFLAKDLNYYEENTQIDEDTFNDLKNAIDTKLRNG